MKNRNIAKNQNIAKKLIFQKSHQAQGKPNDEIDHRNSREFTKRIFCDIPGPIGGRDDGDEGVLGGDHEVRGAVEGVGSGGEHPEGLAAAPVADGSQSKDPTASVTTAFRMKPQTGQGLSGSIECLVNSALKAIYKKKLDPAWSRRRWRIGANPKHKYHRLIQHWVMEKPHHGQGFS